MKKKILLILISLMVCLTSMALPAYAGDSDPVNVPDTAFQTYLNNKLGHASDAILTEGDMKKITKIELSGAVSDVEGVQYCTNLTWFRVNTGVTPENLDRLGNCTKLTFLAIMSTDIEDISFVSGLTELTYLDLYNGEISDISVLKNLKKLTVLDLMGNHVIDMSSLKDIHSQMTHLYGLYETATITLDCTNESGGYCIIDNPVKGIDGKPVEPTTVTNAEFDAAANVFKVAKGTTGFSFKTSQQTISGSSDSQNYFKTTVNVSINHPPKTGSLTVSKTLDGNYTESGRKFDFTISLSDKTVNGTFGGVTFTDGEANISLAGGESITIDGLPDQVEYMVTENNPGDYICSAPSGISGTIIYGTPAAADFINTRNTYYHVTYEIIGDQTYGVPEDSVTPVDDRDYAPGETVRAAPSLTTTQTYAIDPESGVKVEGKWTFISWDPTDFSIQEDTKILGGWEFTPDQNNYPVTPDPDTPDPEPSIDKPQQNDLNDGAAAQTSDKKISKADQKVTPETGDATHTNLLIVILIIASAVLGSCIFYRRRLNRE